MGHSEPKLRYAGCYDSRRYDCRKLYRGPRVDRGGALPPRSCLETSQKLLWDRLCGDMVGDIADPSAKERLGSLTAASSSRILAAYQFAPGRALDRESSPLRSSTSGQLTSPRDLLNGIFRKPDGLAFAGP